MNSCLIVASHFPPINAAGVYRTMRLARFLPDRGWSIHVLTLDPKAYLNGSSLSLDLLEQIPRQTVVHRTSAIHPSEWIARVKSIGFPAPLGGSAGKRNAPSSESTNGSSSAVSSGSAEWDRDEPPKRDRLSRRVKDAVTLPWMTPDRWIGWMPFAVWRGRQILRRFPIDLIYSSGPPWTNHLIAEKLHRSRSIPWVADFRDPWLGNAFRSNRSGDSWCARKHQSLEASVYRHADCVIFNTDRARENAIERIGVELRAKSIVIPNGFDPTQYDSIRSTAAQGDGTQPLKLAHAGSFYGKRNVNELLKVISELKQAGQMTANDLQLELIGRIRDEEQSLIEQYSIGDMVHLIPPIPHSQCLERLSSADVLLLVQTEAPLCVPGKLYEYIEIGRPIFTLASEGATTDLVESADLGYCVDPMDRTALRSALLGLLAGHRSHTLRAPDEVTRDRFNGRNQCELFDSASRQVMSRDLSSPT